MRNLFVGSTKNKKSAVIRAINFNRHLSSVRAYKVNIFQLAKRVRRAKRNGAALVKMLNYNQGPSKHATVRRQIAQAALSRCERVLRVACYYLGNHNVNATGVQVTLAKFQAA